MKTAQDPRHKFRIKKIQSLFAYSFQPDNDVKDIANIITHVSDLDKIIQKAAPEWPLDKINRIDLAILRLATHEILFEKDIPTKVSIDEAVELAKEFGSENSPAFINGVLGTISKEKGILNE